VTVRLPFWPTVLTQGASSFINRVSPANVGGMALNVRYLQKTGVEPSAGVAAVGVNALAGAIVHVVLLVIFLGWAGRGLGQAFKLPSSSKLLLILAYIGGLTASVAAFGARASIAQVGAVYLVASFIAAASPTPGGLGAIEAATNAGLTSIGISSGPAVSAVLIYRLATYWLPVLPGWYSWRLLQRMDYL
jgi:undecaprenyl-diphosphatase